MSWGEDPDELKVSRIEAELASRRAVDHPHPLVAVGFFLVMLAIGAIGFAIGIAVLVHLLTT